MRSLRNVSFLLFLCMLFVLVGCDSNSSQDGETSEGGSLNIALDATPPTLDPTMNSATATRDTTRLMFESLVTTDAEFKPVPMLADSIDVSDDNKVYTFHLREGIKFHNGDEMVAEDVIASMEHWLNNSKVSGNLFDGATWEEEDEYTVVLKLAEPSPLTLDTLATSKQAPGIMPKEVIDDAPAEGVDEYIGTGPFQLNEWKQDQYIHFTKFDDYQSIDSPADGLSGKKEALVDDIYFHLVSETSTRISGLQSGEYDFAYNIPYDNYEQLEQDPMIETLPVPSANALFKFNLVEGISSNHELREIINMALDVDDIMMAAFPNKELYWLDSGYMHEGIVDWASEAGSELHNQNDMEKAKEMLAESDYAGEEFRILTTRDYDHFYNIAVVINEQLQELGLNSTLEIFDWPTVNEVVNEPDQWDGLVVTMSIVSTPPQLLYLSPQWAGGYDDENIPTLMNSIEHADSLEEAQELWDELQLYVWNDLLPLVQFGGFSTVFAMSKDVKGVEAPLGPIFWNVTLE